MTQQYDPREDIDTPVFQTGPATPPRPVNKAAEDARIQRENERRDEATKGYRAKALELAVNLSSAGAQDRPLLPLADVFLRYIESGEHTP